MARCLRYRNSVVFVRARGSVHVSKCFKNKLNAHIAAKKARNAAPEQLGNLPASLQKVNKPLENLKVKRSLWRVRFIELAENQARSVCAELWSSGLSCIPLPQKNLN